MELDLSASRVCLKVKLREGTIHRTGKILRAPLVHLVTVVASSWRSSLCVGLPLVTRDRADHHSTKNSTK